ncbi:MAG: hypothetical protein ACYCPQ_00970 [Elusimicrobiota bacterium]
MKWILWFSGISLYAVILGGFVAYGLFEQIFKQKLIQDTVDMARLYAPILTKGLAHNPGAISFDELDVITKMAHDPRIADVLYLNKYGEVRWFKDATKIAMDWDDFTKQVSLPTNAIQEALVSKEPIQIPVPNSSLLDIAIPLSSNGEILGVIDLQVDQKDAIEIISIDMRKYAAVALVVMIILGFCLYFFLHHFVIAPLLDLRDAVEAISFRTLDLKFPSRPDEIGDVAAVAGLFLSKVKTETAQSVVRDRQRSEAESHWWQSILATIVSRTSKAIVVDEDNAVLYTNFPIPSIPSGSNGKLHLLDVIDAQQQEILRMVGAALERPNQIVEGDTVFRGESCHAKAIHLQNEGEMRRTLILLDPKRIGAHV